MNRLTDQQLLREYAERRSEAAFAELVRRHDFAPTRTLPGESRVGACHVAGGDSLPFGLLLALHTGDRAPRLPSDLSNDSFFLIFRQILHQKIVGPLQFGVAVDLLQDAFANALLAVEFAHFVQDDRHCLPARNRQSALILISRALDQGFADFEGGQERVLAFVWLSVMQGVAKGQYLQQVG